MIDHLIFDTTDFETIDDTHSVGAYVRSGKSGALVSHHGYVQAGSITFDFVDGDVNTGTETITEVGHGLNTGDKVQLSNIGGALPTGLSAATDYYVIRIDADNFQLAASELDAERGNAIDITAAAGGGTHTATQQEKDGRALDVYMVNPIDVNLTQDDQVTVFQGTDPWIIGDGGGSITVDGTVSISGDVNVTQGTSPWVVSATDLDIRDLTHASDSIKIGDGTEFLAINADGSINVVSGAQYNEDDAHASGNACNFVLAVRNDIEGSLVSTDGDYAPLQVDSLGRLRVAADLDIVSSAEKAEDSAHATDDIGNYVLAVRQDTLAVSTSTDGDYASFKVNNLGALYTTIDGDVNVNDAALANTNIAAKVNLLGTDNITESLIPTALVSRKYLFIKNNGNKTMYVGESGMTAANGFPLAPGSILELRAGAAVNVHWVASSAGHDARTLELS
jgi:hypothetical protein